MNTNTIASIQQQLQTLGYAVFGPVISEDYKINALYEIINHIQTLPRIQGHQIRFPTDQNGNIRLGNYTGKEVKELKRLWPPHVTFGAISEPPAFHLQHFWGARQSPLLISLFEKLLGTTDIRITLDRYKAKLPGTGEREFCHWDSNPIEWEFGVENTDIQGILALTEIIFVCVPGTHTREFRDRFVEAYPNIKYGPLTQLDDKNDPWQLCAKEQFIKVPPGYMVIWDSKILHSSHPNKTKDIKIAYYLSYCRSERCLQDNNDRVRSFLTGTAPRLFPSGMKFSYMPKAWIRYPKIAQRYHEHIPEELKSYRTTKTNKINPQIEEYQIQNYQPPNLSPRGYQLLWGQQVKPTNTTT